MRRIPKVEPNIIKPPNVEVKPPQNTPLPPSVSRTTVSTSISSSAASSGSASLLDFLPDEITGGLVTTGLASWIRQEAQKTEYFKRRALERKAKVAVTRNEKKKTKKRAKKNSTALNEDVTMADSTEANQPPTSSTAAK
jgi:ribosomal protein S1